LMIYSWLF